MKDPGSEATLSVSVSLNINNRKGLSKASDITESSEDNILKLK